MDQTLPDRYDNGNVVDRNARSIARIGHMGGRHRAEDIGHVQRPYSKYTPQHELFDPTGPPALKMRAYSPELAALVRARVVSRVRRYNGTDWSES